MNYKQIYDNIIANRKIFIHEGYCEKHHIIPRCLGGNDDKENLVKLTAKEHFICHLLLTKIYKNTLYYGKLVHAFMMMLSYSKNNQRYITSKKYDSLRNEFSKRMSELRRGKYCGSENSQYGTRWISNVDLKVNKKIKKAQDIPDGWVLGMNAWNRKIVYKDESLKNKYIFLWEKYLNGDYSSANEFCKKEYYGTLAGLTLGWKKHIPEYSNLSRKGISLKKKYEN